MELEFSKIDNLKKGVYIFLVNEDLRINGTLSKVDKQKAIAKAIEASSQFKGKKGQILSVAAPFGIDADKVVLIGLGKSKEVDELSLQSVGGKLVAYLNYVEIENAKVVVESIKDVKETAGSIALNLAIGAKLKNYRFNKYFVAKKDENKVHLKKLAFLMEEHAKVQRIVEDNLKVIDGVFFTKNLVSTPPNILYPATFAAECKQLQKLGIKLTVLKEKDMEKLGMNSLLGVGKGSEKESHLIVMEWNGHPKGKKEKPVAFVGKGVTFDTGGISLKPAAGMADMKYDMAGAGVVAGLMKALASRKAKVNVVGVIGVVENMPSGSAQRPSDVVVSMSGQTIEIDNTDAEGRLVLADALWYTQGKFEPKFMVDLATLTGAIVVALGENCYGGLFANDEKLAEQLIEAGNKVGELLWRMPLKEHYDKQINSEIADVRNTGTGKGGGSITAAQFLQRFVNKCAWAHLDIAGMAWDKVGNDICNKGATGFGVRLLNKFVLDNYEAK